MKRLLCLIGLLWASMDPGQGLDFTYSTNLFYALPFTTMEAVLAALRSAGTNGIQSFSVVQQMRGSNTVWVVRVGLK